MLVITSLHLHLPCIWNSRSKNAMAGFPSFSRSRHPWILLLWSSLSCGFCLVWETVCEMPNDCEEKTIQVCNQHPLQSVLCRQHPMQTWNLQGFPSRCTIDESVNFLSHWAWFVQQYCQTYASKPGNLELFTQPPCWVQLYYYVIWDQSLLMESHLVYYPARSCTWQTVVKAR